MRKFILATIITISFFFTAFAGMRPLADESQPSGAEADAGVRLPVRRVVLYKNGMGYFEHATRIRGNQDLAIDFTTSQLNDVLKSLTAVDLGEGRISGVRYNSIAPLDERLKALRLPFGEQLTRIDFLAALRGARVEVHNGSEAATGRLLSVEKEKRFNEKGDSYEVTEFSVMSDSGDMRNFDLGPSTSVRLAERDLSDEVEKYLNLIGSSRARDLRRMTISATGTGEREIFFSYISEVPVWKSTYRIILPEKPNEKPVLQGWAIVDNTVGEDWKDVQLSLIAGAPQSFIQDISRPLYTRRPVVPLPQAAMLTPQTQEASMTAPAPASTVAETVNVDGQALMTMDTAPGQGGGVGGGVISGDRNSLVNSRARLNPFAAAAKQQAEAESKDLGDYFEYNLKQKITIGKNQSALVPILQSPIEAEKVTLWNENTRDVQIGRPGRLFRIQPQAENHNRQKSVCPGANSAISHRSGKGYPLEREHPRRSDRKTWATISNTTSSRKSQSAKISLPWCQFCNLPSKRKRLPSGTRTPATFRSEDLGDYFEYNLKQKITIGKNQSALVPILQSPIEAEKVTLWNENTRDVRRALWITNSSGLTLDSGTFNILESDTFAGEGLIETVHPAERRLISYAADPALRVTMEQESSEKPVTRIHIFKGLMYLTREQRDSRKYSLHNADAAARQVVIEHPARENWKQVEGPKPEETSASYLRFRIEVPAGQTANLHIEEFHPENSEFALTNLDDKQVAFIAQQRQLTPAMQEAFHRVLEQKNKVDSMGTQIKNRQHEVETITKDQARLRENMKALKGSAEEKALLQRYARQLDSQEDRLNTLAKEITDLQEKQNQARAQLDQTVQQITLDESF